MIYFCNRTTLFTYKLLSPFKAIASKGLVEELDAIEQAFDDAFVEMISQEYYMRIFQDVFDEIFSAKVDHLAVTLAKERSK